MGPAAYPEIKKASKDRMKKGAESKSGRMKRDSVMNTGVTTLFKNFTKNRTVGGKLYKIVGPGHTDQREGQALMTREKTGKAAVLSYTHGDVEFERGKAGEKSTFHVPRARGEALVAESGGAGPFRPQPPPSNF